MERAGRSFVRAVERFALQEAASPLSSWASEHCPVPRAGCLFKDVSVQVHGRGQLVTEDLNLRPGYGQITLK